ncbi:MAG: serine/threonine-protein kinase [Myxococcales bacterium]
MPKRQVMIAVAVVALIGGAVGGIVVHRFNQRALRRLADQLSGNARTQARSALADKLKLIETQAMAGAQLPQIRGQIAVFDPATLADGFRSESWWEPFRNDFSVYGVADDSEKLQAVEGMAATDIDASPMIAAARAHRSTSGFLRAGPKSWPYAAGAAVIDVPGRAVPAVIFLAQAVDQAFVQDLAAKAGGAVMISDGKSALLSAGNDAEQVNLKAAIGREQDPQVEGDTWSAASSALLPGLTLWTYAGVGAQAEEYRRDETTSKTAVWAVALIVAGIALFQGLRKQPEGVTGATGESGRTPVAQKGMTGSSGISGPGHLYVSSGPEDEDPEGATAISKAPPKPAPQNMFGRYMLLDRLGEGGMAEVYTAVTYGAEGFRRTFVVKRLRKEMSGNKDVVSAFIDEANLAASLVHTNIVPVFDFGKEGDEYFMAQEYILGRDLGRVNRRALEKEGKPLPLHEVFYVAHETLKALDYAHGKTGNDGKPMNLVHRDVSPNNILVSARGEVKLFDFGIAKAANRITQTQFGMVKGNVRFMSPEQARGDPVDSRSDLFAIGLVIYYALSGDALYTADTAYNLLVKAAQGPGEKELANLKSLPKEAQRVLERALQSNAADRYQTAAEFAQALAPFIAGAHDALARTMERLFGEDIKAEEARFASAGAAGAAASEGDSGSTAVQSTKRFAQPGKA